MLAQFIGQGVGRLFAFLTAILLTRDLGPKDYGTLSFYLALIALFGQPLFNDGVDAIVTKHAVLKKPLFASALLLKALGLGLAIVLFFGLSLYKGYSLSGLFILLLYTFSLSVQSLAGGFFRGSGGITFDAVLSAVFKGAILLSVFLGAIVSSRPSLPRFEYALLMGGAFGLLLILAASGKRLFSGATVTLSTLKTLFLETYPLTLAGFFWILYFKINQAMLGFMGTSQDLGYFAAAYKMMEAFFFLPTVFMSVSFPKLTSLLSTDAAEFRGKLKSYSLLLAAGGAVTSAIAWAVSPWLITFAYGPAFAASVPIFKVLLFAIPFVFLGTMLTQTFTILGYQKIFMWLTLWMALLNLGLNYLSIPRWGALGAAWATILTEGAMTFLAMILIRKFSKRKEAGLEQSLSDPTLPTKEKDGPH